MGQADRQKWDRRFGNRDQLIEKAEASPLLKQYYCKAGGTRALDVACGTGRNSLFLAAQGFKVDALDISPVGLQRLAAATADGVTIHTRQVDLDDYVPPEVTYDLIIMANYLNRDLIPKLGRSLRPGGILIIDTFMAAVGKGADDFNPDYLLNKGELPGYFAAEFEILTFTETANESSPNKRPKQAIAVCKKG